MECRDIREKLSAYREGMVSPEDQALIDEHLVHCGPCSTALYESDLLAETLKRIPEVEPPPGMKQRIMARIREDAAPKKSVFQKLFYPLHIKVPLQAVATVLVAFSAVYIFKASEPQMKIQPPAPAGTAVSREEAPAKPPAAAPPVQDKAAPEAGAKTQESKSADTAVRKQEAPVPSKSPAAPAATPPAPVAPAQEKSLLRAEAEQVGKKDAAKPEAGAAPAERLAQNQPPPAAPQAYSISEPKKETSPAESQAAPPAVVDAVRTREASPPVAAAPAPAPRAKQKEARLKKQESPRRLSRAGSAAESAKLRSEPVSVKITAKDIRSAADRAAGILKGAGASVSQESREDAEILYSEVKGEKVGEVMEKLKSAGEIESKDARDTAGNDAYLRIVIVPEP
ncbi:MAG TPA: zf-HC2 domain-containing protein [Thermodesulfobacteriota bacterium]|nr:zf-HC2 domain-containing protein [Thermodesulfobacteriota bacterium]